MSVVGKICTRTLLFVSAAALLLIVFMSRNYMFSSCRLRETTLRLLGKKEFLDLETDIFKGGDFMKGNIVIENRIVGQRGSFIVERVPEQQKQKYLFSGLEKKVGSQGGDHHPRQDKTQDTLAAPTAKERSELPALPDSNSAIYEQGNLNGVDSRTDIQATKGQSGPTVVQQYPVDEHGALFDHDAISAAERDESFANLETALQNRAKDREIVLAIVDARYAEFAFNLYQTSLKKFSLSNYLMVCIDDEGFQLLSKQGLFCVRYEETEQDENAGDFGSDAYVRKTNLKTWIVLQILKLGYTVLVTDLDVVLFQNPFPYFDCEACDLHVTQDRVQANSGFIYVRPTAASKYLYHTAWGLYQKYHQASDQSYLNSALRVLENEGSPVRVKLLPRSTFQCGVYYFQEGGREFAGDRPPCTDCVMVHNNYIGSLAAKVYRFKENLLWVDDTNEYYSSSKAKYLTYDNPHYFKDKTWEYEIDALKSALRIAKILNRILILPRFHCCECEKRRCESDRHRCSMLSLLNVKTFDQEFHGQYREHVFLQNPLVPQKYKESSGTIHAVVAASNSDILSDLTSNSSVKVAQFNSPISVRDLVNYFEPFSGEPVLRLHSMYGLQFADNQFNATAMDNALQCMDYEQWDIKGRDSHHG